VRLTVQDTGVGFNARDAEQLFDAFYTTKAGGMGSASLSVASIIEAHHGGCGRSLTMDRARSSHFRYRSRRMAPTVA
jgi:nitrogen fixation/metabolism regulation signal transduction histidine kinase